MLKAQYCQLTQKVKRVLFKVLREDLRKLVESGGLWAGCHLDHSSCRQDHFTSCGLHSFISLSYKCHYCFKIRAKLINNVEVLTKVTFYIFTVHLNYINPYRN